jgi:hypothetical protein
VVGVQHAEETTEKNQVIIIEWYEQHMKMLEGNMKGRKTWEPSLYPIRTQTGLPQPSYKAHSLFLYETMSENLL